MSPHHQHIALAILLGFAWVPATSTTADAAQAGVSADDTAAGATGEAAVWWSGQRVTHGALGVLATDPVTHRMAQLSVDPVDAVVVAGDTLWAWSADRGEAFQPNAMAVQPLALADLKAWDGDAGGLVVALSDRIEVRDPATGEVWASTPMVVSDVAWGDGVVWAVSAERTVVLDPFGLTLRQVVTQGGQSITAHGTAAYVHDAEGLVHELGLAGWRGVRMAMN